MENNKKGETLAGIIVSVTIFSIVIFGIVSMLDFQNKNEIYIKENLKNKIVEVNIKNILKKMEIPEASDTNTNSTFYLNYNSTDFEINENENSEFSDNNGRFQVEIKKRGKIEGIELSPEIKITKK